MAKHANGQCETVFERNVSRDDSQKKVYYDIKVHQCGNCKINLVSMNWVLIPKIPDDYEVVFNVIEK